MNEILAILILALGIDPPKMPARAVAPGNDKAPGEQMQLREGKIPFTLYIPQAWNSNASAQRITLHFHTAPWFIVQEHVRRGSAHPLACFHLGEGSSVYRQAFEDSRRMDRVLTVIIETLQQRATNKLQVAEVELSSFSAGYGAIRELVKTTNRFSAVVLADSMYAALAADAASRQPAPEHINVWLPLARAAMNRHTTFVLTYSEVPTTAYASSSECAAALIRVLRLTNSIVPPDGTSFPLLRRADLGNLHLWGYAGTNAQAHMTHARHLADIWKSLDDRK